jgi:SAM-dependent methyltransferase/uncharacterized protein YbaR (Trm112 family)
MDMLSYLACPQCHQDLAQAPGSLRCGGCGRAYPVNDDVPQFSLSELPTGTSAGDRRDYWDSGWQARHAGDHAYLHELRSPEQWQAFIRQQMAAVPKQFHAEVGAEVVRDRVMLEIGCGAGTSSATFGYLGARYIGVDHSPSAAYYSLAHLRAIRGDGFTAQGNAEALPIRDQCVDVVYSHGVLHHTPKFSTAMDEVYRVLKPCGKAVIALYSTYSIQLGALRLKGALSGNVGREAMQRWMGRATEVHWRTGGKMNLWTDTYSVRELRRFMRRYAVDSLQFRKYGSPIRAVPRVGHALLRLAMVRRLDDALEPLLGSMVIMSFSKSNAGS